MYLTVIGSFGFADPDPARTLSAWAELAGVRAVQAYRNTENSPTVEQMLAWAGSAGLAFDSLHGVFGPRFDPSSPDEDVRRFSVDAYRAEGQLVRRLGGDMVVVHPSPAVMDYNGDDRPERLRQLARSIDELSAIGRQLAVDFLIENQPPYHPVGADTAELVEVVRRCRRERIGFCFDTGHAHMAGDEAAALRSVGSLLRMVHASDNNGRLDEHLLCFDGAVDWAGVGGELRAMDFDGPFMFEVFFTADQLRPKLTASWRRRLLDVLGLGAPIAE